MKWLNLILFLSGLFLIDVLSLNHIWGENFHRRSYHHFQRCTYDPRRKPNIQSIQNLLTQSEVAQILDWTKDVSKEDCLSKHWSSTFISGQYSELCTLYYDDFPADIQNKLNKVGHQLESRLSQQAGKRLYLSNSSNFRCTMLKYKGEKAQFGWHYDTEPYVNYRTIIMLKKKGEIPKFKYRTSHKNVSTVDLNVSDGILFQGTRTYHMVEPTNDENALRYVIGWQYTPDPNITEATFCSQLRSSSTYETLVTLLPYFALTLLLSYFTPFNIDTKEMNILIGLLGVVMMAIIHLPYQLPDNIGTGIPSGIWVNIWILEICLLSTFRISNAAVFFIYLTITEMLLPRWMVGGHLDYLM